jgi:hypothetical protein
LGSSDQWTILKKKWLLYSKKNERPLPVFFYAPKIKKQGKGKYPNQ